MRAAMHSIVWQSSRKHSERTRETIRPFSLCLPSRNDFLSAATVAFSVTKFSGRAARRYRSRPRLSTTAIFIAGNFIWLLEANRQKSQTHNRRHGFRIHRRPGVGFARGRFPLRQRRRTESHLPREF